MQSGRQTLSQIEGAVAQVQDDESRIDTSLHAVLGRQETLRGQRTDALRELARVKLTEMAAGRLVGNLDAAEQHAYQLLEDRKYRLVTSSARRELALREVAAAEQAGHAAGTAVEQALAAVETIRAGAERTVQAQPGWQAAKAGTDAAAAIAAEADKKATQSEGELGAKKLPYDGDPLFLYLWNRNFGTQRYKAGTDSYLVSVIDQIGSF